MLFDYAGASPVSADFSLLPVRKTPWRVVGGLGLGLGILGRAEHNAVINPDQIERRAAATVLPSRPLSDTETWTRHTSQSNKQILAKQKDLFHQCMYLGDICYAAAAAAGRAPH